MKLRSSAIRLLLLLVLPMLTGAEAHAARAHCFCKLTLQEHRTSNPSDFRKMTNVEKLAEGSIRIPDWEKIQGLSSGSCRSECRKAFGAPSGPVSPAAAALKAELLKQAVVKGKPADWCGGWLSATLEYAVGTYRYKEATGELIGVGDARSCGLVNACKWTPWLNRDSPRGTGDFETLQDFLAAGQACTRPKRIECQTADGRPASSTGQPYTCEPSVGGVCDNRKLPAGQLCRDYRVRFCC